MAFEADPCLVRAGTGELLARGFVREHDGVTMLVEAEHAAGSWLEPGDAVVAEVLSSQRGACTYDAVVGYSVANRIELTDLQLQTVVQQRSALRVATSLPHRVSYRLEGTARVVLDEPLAVVVLDVSGHGLRFRTAAELEIGDRLLLTFEAVRVPLDLVLEVLRVEEMRGGLAYGCRFVDLRERDADAMFTFVLEEQRRQLVERRNLTS